MLLVYKLLLTGWILFSSLTTYQSFGQDLVVVDQSVNPAGVVDEMPLSPPSTEGSHFLKETWELGTIFFRNKHQITNIYLNYNLNTDVVEIKDGEKIRLCPMSSLTQFNIFTEQDTIQYKNANDFDKGDLGLYQILFEKGHHTLVKKTTSTVTEPTYVMTHNVGSKNRKIILKHSYILFSGHEKKILKQTKKSILNASGRHYLKMKNFLRESKINLKDDVDLIRVIDFLLRLQGS